MRTRAERRNNTYKKWVSKLKKLFKEDYIIFINPVKTSGKRVRTWSMSEYMTRKKSESYKDYMTDKTGVLFKNTGTIYDKKRYTIQEMHKKRIQDRSVSIEDQLDAQEVIEDFNDIWSFEKYCQPCIYYNTEECPFLNKVCGYSKWREVGCDKFWD